MHRKTGWASRLVADAHAWGRSGKRRALPWARLIDATAEDGEFLLSFTGREGTFYGLNLGGLLEAVVECRLEKVWELPADYRPPTNLKRPCVSKIEVRDSDCGFTAVHGTSSASSMPKVGVRVKVPLSFLRDYLITLPSRAYSSQFASWTSV